MNRILGQILILKINYNHINNVNKEKNLEIFKKPLKDFSHWMLVKISFKKKEFNENLIKEIFSQSNDENNKDSIINFLLENTLNDWKTFLLIKLI